MDGATSASVDLISPAPRVIVDGHPTYQALRGEVINILAIFHNADPLPEVSAGPFIACVQVCVQDTHIPCCI